MASIPFDSIARQKMQSAREVYRNKFLLFQGACTIVRLNIPIYCVGVFRMTMASDKESQLGKSKSFAVASASISTSTAEDIFLQYYGLKGIAYALAAERDHNFRIRCDNDREYLLRIVHPSEDPRLTEMQTQAMLHVAKTAPDLPVQRVLLSVDGMPEVRRAFGTGDERTIRAVSFLQGVLQRDRRSDASQRQNVGKALARLQLALEDFNHPSSEHELIWDLRRASALRPLVATVDDAELRISLERQLDHFDAKISAVLQTQRRQVVHNDLSSDNILVSSSAPADVTGILDFGDLVKTSVCADVAIGAVYQLQDGPEAFEGALDLISGFNSVRQLFKVEQEILFDLILTRMAARIIITEWRASVHPENRRYILRNTPRARQQFQTLLHQDKASATASIIKACLS
ncbi:phosphotransferase [Phyllobacterium chamaecytisi]|uniref:phosphotransferase n=1 Tax=Phyllobacterium chamaecytisi TaxID=2876082 RepID=UPI001CCA032D|nr:phosphotransferase [Phyllobacterium sp. KW56]MBZ9603149.1 phosphotransferase [Phyllobacterium sp. KW56]